MLPLLLTLLTAPQDPAPVDFARDVRPLFARRCLECHGPAKRKGGLRLDLRSEALRGGDNGPALAPAGHLWVRVNSADPDEQMPPKGDRLTAGELDLLRRWLAAGAPWPEDASGARVISDHWAFQAVKRPAPPAKARHPIDAFVAAELEKRGLALSPPADRRTLARRLSLDLIGLPPSPEEVDAFVADGDYDKLVDRLLASPHYGERWARRWLDLARYADTNGYEKDRARSIWPWRDWVIRAINEDLPFDRFTIEQLAGDLTGAPLATGFHRNTMTNEEGGIDVEEFRFESVVDRVGTTATVWLGLTVACAQCHSHKFDPITQREYYRLFAYFNNADEPEVPVADPAVAKKREDVLNRIRELEATLLARDEPEVYAAWKAGQTVRWTHAPPVEVTATKGGTFDVLADDSVLVSGDNPNNNAYTVTLPRGGRAVRLEVLPHESLPEGGPGRAPLFQTGDFLLSEIRVEGAKIAAGFHSYAQGGRSAAQAFDGKLDTGWSVKGRTGEAHHAVFVFEEPVQGLVKVTLTQEYIHQMTIGRFRFSTTDDVPAEAGPAAVDEKHWRLSVRASPEREEIAKLRKSLPRFATTLVMKERRPELARKTRVHHRGLFLAPKEEVEPGVPAVLPPTDAKDRLGFARWLVDAKNPLTPRVLVNRHWQAFFGRGLVATLENFGVRGETPSHPALLDWLASEVVERKWSIKALHRLIVTSETYRQASTVSAEHLAKDPENRWYARAARFRLEAELLRDQALAVSGLLDRRIGGPSVHPPQPEGVWETAYGSPQWPSSQGGDRYRRGLYTYMKRAAPYAAFACFDAPSGEFCAARRDRSNTPLQALNLLNDAVYMEAARALGKGAATADALFRRVLGRSPTPSERDVLDGFAAKHGWEKAARVVLNLDETVTRP
ncbi:MAG TPA: PSD1 and planctomycete cytochrome C domain-containing protein [Planctomycetota bacterium]